ncbi:RNA-directed DNA polymerase, eukaryota, reverse transcriptase zinc-binding domain protein [Tanacetum coccineum]
MLGVLHLVQKRDPNVEIVKECPSKIHVWIKLLNVPLEAWNVKVISAISTRLGRPIKIDQMAADMCKEDSNNNVKRSKWVKVEYSWKLDRCRQCCVFGHSTQACGTKSKSQSEANENGIGNVKFTFRPKVSVPVTKENPMADGQNLPSTSPSRNEDPKGDKNQWQAMERGDGEINAEEYVFESHNQAVNSLIADDIEGNAGDIFRRWKWISNVRHSSNSCRIVIGWNSNEIDIMVVHCSREAIFCLVEFKNLKETLYISFIYASNSNSERRELWKDMMV